MAICTGVGIGVEGMAENSLRHWWSLIGQFWASVTFATLVNIKGLFAVVAGTTGFTFFHVSHGNSRILAGFVQLCMARGAVFDLDQVIFVTEWCRAGFLDLIDDFLDLVTFAALMGIKGLLSVVAGAAGLALVHISHGIALFGLIACMTGGTTEGRSSALILLGKVLLVAENNCTSIFCAVADIFQVDCKAA